MNRVFVILGPTSSGKTSLALNLCKQFNGEIISADSRQQYKMMDIGTGKVPIGGNCKIEKHNIYWSFNNVRIWGYDLSDPNQYFSAYDFASWALPVAKKLIEEGKTVFLVGGTGFFTDMFTGQVKPSQVKPDFNLRKELEKLDLIQLQRKLMSLNLEVYEKIDKNNTVRLIRAIEIELGTTRSPTSLPYLENAQFKFIGLHASRDFLYKRVDGWLDNIWQNGLISETKSLISAGYDKTQALNGIIYKSAKAYINGELAEYEAKQQAKFALHAYIRRQQTYFKKNKDITWFDIKDSKLVEKVTQYVANNITSNVKSS